MKYKIIILLGLSVLTTSCEKITNVTLVDGISTGKLSYQLNDDSGKGLAGIKVSLYDSETVGSPDSPNPNALVSTKLTDQEGIAYFPDLLPKDYFVTTESVTVNNNKYKPFEFVQIVADTEKKRIVKVSDFSGLLNITLLSDADYSTPLKNMGIIAYPVYDSTHQSDNISEYVKVSTLKGVTDENGFISFKVPSNTTYDFIIYGLTNGNFGYKYSHYVNVEKDMKTSVRLFSPAF